MTDREAIIELDSIAYDFENSRLDTEKWVGYEYDSDEAAEAVRMGIKAIEKQIPKKVKISPDDYGTCPNCKNVLRFTGEYRYCSNCGQALDWSNREVKDGKGM